MTTKGCYRKSPVFGLRCFSASMCVCSPGTLLERLNTLEGVISIFCRGTASVIFVPPLPSVSTGCEMSFTRKCCFKNTFKSYATVMQKGLRSAVTEQSGFTGKFCGSSPVLCLAQARVAAGHLLSLVPSITMGSEPGAPRILTAFV